MAAGFPQTVYQKVGQTTKASAAATARAMASQSSETLKVAKAQMGLPQLEKPVSQEHKEEVPQIVQELQKSGAESIDREAIASRERAMLSELEHRLSEIRAKRTESQMSYREAVQTTMDAQNASPAIEVSEPQGKIRKAMGRAKKAITSIISNRKQGETKQGSGKG